VIGDLTKPVTLAGIAANVEVIYHLAGTLSGGPAHMRRVMLDGTRNLIHQCCTVDVSHTLRAFIFTSNAAVYGDGAGAALTEESPCRPCSPLGRLSVMAEDVPRLAAAEHGLPAITLRLGAIYGPERLSSGLLREGRFRIIGSGRNYSRRIHIDDLIAVLLVLRHGAPRPVYCVADADPSPVNDYYGLLASLLRVPPPSHVPAWAVRARAHMRNFAVRSTGRPARADTSIVGLFTNDQRLDGSTLCMDFKLRLRYCSYREGLLAAIAAERKSETLVEAST
jgi:nucleoside-diphosphate-sugar epimerase